MTLVALPAATLRIRWSQLRALAPPDLKLLDDSERERAARFLVDDARQRFLVGRICLRHLLGVALDCPPEELSFTPGEHGKPTLATPATAPAFNLSHSGDVVVVALAWCHRLGIDVEPHGGGRDGERLARRFFAPAEAAAVVTAAVPEPVFLHLWTAKEAWMKAIGAGLTIAPRAVEVSPDPSAPPRLLALPPGHDPTTWTLLRIPLPLAATCTAALPAGQWQLDLAEWRPQ